jgi:hypothetical protein
MQGRAPVVDQAHAGDSGLGLLELRHVDFHDMEAAVRQGLDGARVAGG